MYIDQTKDKIMEVLRLFLQHEQGNRVTIFNINGLVNRLDRIFIECEQQRDQKPKKKGQ